MHLLVDLRGDEKLSVKVMKLCELVPSIKTEQHVLSNLRFFLKDTLEKGVVDAKDTVNFIGNRIGCYWMLKGIHEKGKEVYKDLTIEEIDAVISKPMGIPPTGLFGLIDLIGLDVMYSVGKNLEINLPEKDMGRPYVNLPTNEQGEHADFNGPGNNYSIGIEMCEHRGNSRQETLARTAKLCASLMQQYDIPLKNVVPHYHWPRKGLKPEHKNCPHFLMTNGKPGRKWNQFLRSIKKQYNRIQIPQEIAEKSR